MAALRENPRFAPTPFVLGELDDVREALAARGVAPVFFASVGSPPAANVAAGRGAMALPDRLWSGDCTFRGPESALPIEAWAERLVAFLERGEEQGLRRGRARCRGAPLRGQRRREADMGMRAECGTVAHGGRGWTE